MRKKDYPTQAELNRIFKYDPETGNFYNKIYRNSKSVAGQKVGCLTKIGYLAVTINYKQYFVHTLIWIMIYGSLPEKMIDHKNRNKSDNRLKNLRLASDFENQYNRPAPKDNTSGYKGVSFCKQTGNWQAAIGFSGKRKHLGRFKTKEDAHKAYCNAAKKFHNEFVRTE